MEGGATEFSKHVRPSGTKERDMKHIASFLILLLCASAVFAQTTATVAADEERIKISKPRCSITLTDVEGIPDGFAGGNEPTSPSPALAGFLVAPTRQYDEGGCDKRFGESFRLCSCENCGATLTIQVRRCGSLNSAQLNDGWVVGIAPFTPGLRVADGLVWSAGDPQTKTLTIPLSAAQLTKVLCAKKSQWLDVYIQDDTIVDSMTLTILQP